MSAYDDGPLDDDPKRSLSIAKKIGYPVLIKAAGGGGGRGIRVVRSEAALINSKIVMVFKYSFQDPEATYLVLLGQLFR